MKTARNAMTGKPETLRPNDTILEAAKRLAHEDVGSLPVCNTSGELEGIITDRDIVVKVIAKGLDPKSVTTGQVETKDPVTISPDAPLEDAMRMMAENRVRRLPVVEGRTIIGMISQGDLARELPNEKAGEMVAQISQ